jgi:hypothetical protein
MFAMKALKGIPSHAAGVLDRPHQLSSYLVDKGERYAGAATFGYVKGYYRDKAYIKGLPPDLLAGAILTLGAVIAEAATGGRSKIAPHLNALGDAGMMSWVASKAAAYGVKQSGRTVYVLEAGAKAPSALPPGMRQTTVLGAQTNTGAWLSDADIMNFRARR